MSFGLVDIGVRERFELVDEMEVRDNRWYEEVEGVDGVFWRELESDGVLWMDPRRRGVTGVVGCEGRWDRGGTGFGKRGVELWGSVTEDEWDGAENGVGDTLDADPGENVNIEGSVLLDMNMGAGFFRAFEFDCEFDCEVHDV